MKMDGKLRYLLLICLVITLVGCGMPASQSNPATQTAVSALRTLKSYDFLTPTASDPTPTSPISTLSPNEPTAQVNPVLTALVPQPTIGPTATAQPEVTVPAGHTRYVSLAGDTLPAVAGHFGVEADRVLTFAPVSRTGYLPKGTVLGIPPLDPEVELEDILELQPALPDSEIVYGPGTADFDVIVFAEKAGGFLTRYNENVDSISYSGPQIVQMVARDTSTNPRLLLAFLEFQSNWVFGNPAGAATDKYPIGFGAADSGLRNELLITAKLLAQGFYGWRSGTFTTLTFFEGSKARLDPTSNAGSVAVQHLFATMYRSQYFQAYLYGPEGFLAFYQDNFGSPWVRASAVGDLVDEHVSQPDLVLPFLPGLRWSLTAGPHTAWHTGTPRGAVDFAPVTGEPPCAVSAAWVTAAAPGLVVRSGDGVVAIDLDGDGNEGTGWVLIYLHLAEKERIARGVRVKLDDQVGHPSCERGNSTGTHTHFTRKYNGQWLAATGPLPMVLDGWTAFADAGYYLGGFTRGSDVVRASSSGMSGSSIFRDK